VHDEWRYRGFFCDEWAGILGKYNQRRDFDARKLCEGTGLGLFASLACWNICVVLWHFMILMVMRDGI
jgi:hypothetical protein